MILYRIVKCNYAEDLTGTGARLFGGRWNSEGKPALYLASSRSLAVLEVLVHLPPLMIPDNYCLVEIEIPGNSINVLAVKDMPIGWKDISPPIELKQIGDKFLRNQKQLLLQLPSAIVPEEHNFMLNPLHPEMKNVKILSKQAFNFDERLV